MAKRIKVEVKGVKVSKKAEKSAEKLKFMNFMNSENASYPSTMATELCKRFDKILVEKDYFKIRPSYNGSEQSYLSGSKLSEDWYHLLNDYNTKFNNVVHSVFQEVCNTVPFDIATDFNPNLSSGRSIHYLTSQKWKSAVWQYIENCVIKYSDYIHSKGVSWDFISIDNSYTRYSIMGIKNRYDVNRQFETIQAFIWYLVVSRGEQIPVSISETTYVNRGYYLQLLLDNANIAFDLSNKTPVNHWQQFSELNKME